MTYVDGFVAAVPAANKEIYRKHAAEAAPLFKEFGATRVVECWGDDVPKGKLTDFYGAVKARGRRGRGVFLDPIWPDKGDPRRRPQEDDVGRAHEEPWGKDMPFDGKRMIFGGFVPIFDV